MMCPKQLSTLGLAFVAFAVLPSAFWSGIAYWVISPDAAKAVGIGFFIAGLYTCYRGSKNNYHWFNRKCNKQQPTQYKKP